MSAQSEPSGQRQKSLLLRCLRSPGALDRRSAEALLAASTLLPELTPFGEGNLAERNPLWLAASLLELANRDDGSYFVAIRMVSPSYIHPSRLGEAHWVNTPVL
jgi:hypothetical protein